MAIEKSKLSKKLKNKRIIKWLLLMTVLWSIPTFMFWAGVSILHLNVEKRTNARILNNLTDKLDKFAYESMPEQYFEPKLKVFFSHVKGLPVKPINIQRIIEGFKNTFSKGLMDIYLFDGKGKICKTKGAKIEFEEYYRLINSDVETCSNIPTDKMASLSHVIPFPTYALKESRGQKGRVVSLGNPDNFSLCYYDKSTSINSHLIGGILIFIHLKHLDRNQLLNETIVKNNPKLYGYINKDSKSRLPELLSGHTADELLNYYNLYPLNKFKLGSDMVVLKRIDSHSIIVGANKDQKSILPEIWLGFVVFLLTSAFLASLTYKLMVNRETVSHTIRTRLKVILTIIFAIPFSISSILARQYLSEYKFEVRRQLEQENFNKLSSLDNGFNRFVTHELLMCRNITANLKKLIHKPNAITKKFDELYKTFKIDSLHLIASDGSVIYSNELITAEIRRHYNRSDKFKNKIFKSWQERQSNITTKHVNILFSKPDANGDPPIYRTTPNRTFVKILKYTTLSVVDFYNKAHGIISVKPSNSSLIINAMTGGSSKSFLQSAKSNIGKFTYMKGLDEVHLAYTDILPGPKGEAWYVVVMLIDLATMEREYLESLYSERNRANANLESISKDDDIRAASMHQFSMNFPGIFEFRTFAPLFKRQSNRLRTITKEMIIDGKRCIVNAIKCSYLSHYMLIDVKPLSIIHNMYNKMRNIILLFLSGLAFSIILLSLYAINEIAKPIEDINLEVKAIFEKDLSQHPTDSSILEFSTISNAFLSSRNIIEEMDITTKIRKKLTPSKELSCGSYKIQASTFPGNLILGNFHDYFPMKNGTAIVILAEISGDDLEGTYLASMIKVAFAMLAPRFPNNPSIIMEKINKLLHPYRAKDHTITCLIALVEPISDLVTCVNAGYKYPAISSKESCKLYPLPSTPLGISYNTKFTEHKINLRKSDLIFYSDGTLEIENKSGLKLGSDGFIQIASSLKGKSHHKVDKELMLALHNYSGDKAWRKDVSVLVIHSTI